MQNQEASKETTYNWKWHWFIEGLISGKDQYVAYAESQGYDLADPKTNKESMYVRSSELVRNVKFQEFYQEYLQAHGFNDAEVDKGLLSLIKSDNPKVQLPAMEMYNKLRSRYITRTDVTTKGMPIQVIDIKSLIANNDTTNPKTT